MDINRNSEMARTLGLGSGRGSRMRRMKWAAIIAAILIALAIAALWASSSSKKDAPRYTTASASRGSLEISVTATGTLQPVNQVVVGSELSGTIRSVAVDFNDRVKKAQVLARLDATTLKAQVIQAEASLKSAEAGVSQADVTLKQSEDSYNRIIKAWKLSSGAAVSENDVATAEAELGRASAALTTAEAQLAEARAKLAVSRDNLSKSDIVSPIDGVVLNRAVEPGQTVAASLQAPVLFTIAEDLAQMELHVFVDEADVGSIEKGQHASFTVDAYPDRKFDAKITELRYTPTETEGVVTYETILFVDNSDLSLRPGMTATAEISTARIDNALLIPNAALRFSPPKTEGEDQGSFLSRMFARRRHTNNQANGQQKHDAQGVRIWVMSDVQFGDIEPLTVKTGASDGSMTAIINGPLLEGMKVVTGVQAKAK